MVVILIRDGADVLDLMPEPIHESLEQDLDTRGVCCYERRSDGTVNRVDTLRARVMFKEVR